MVFYVRNRNGNYVPVSFKSMITNEWNGKMVIVRIGTEENPADVNDLDETMDSLSDADALASLENTSFLVTRHELSFEVLTTVNDLENQSIGVRVVAGDDLTMLGELQKKAKEQLKGAKRVIILPTPLTVKEYKEVMDVKKRCDIRRGRRGR